MKAKDFYKKENYPKLDKFDKKANKFTYYDLIEFAERYHKSKNMNQMNDYALWFVKNFDDLYELTFQEVYNKWLKITNDNK